MVSVIVIAVDLGEKSERVGKVKSSCETYNDSRDQLNRRSYKSAAPYVEECVEPIPVAPIIIVAENIRA